VARHQGSPPACRSRGEMLHRQGRVWRVHEGQAADEPRGAEGRSTSRGGPVPAPGWSSVTRTVAHLAQGLGLWTSASETRAEISTDPVLIVARSERVSKGRIVAKPSSGPRPAMSGARLTRALFGIIGHCFGGGVPRMHGRREDCSQTRSAVGHIGGSGATRPSKYAEWISNDLWGPSR